MAERPRAFHPLLARLEFRRALGGTALLILGAAVLLVTRDWTGDWTPGSGSTGSGSAGSGSSGTDGLARQAVWSGVLLLLIPLATLHAASLPHRWRAGEADWLGSRPVGPGPALASVLAGMLAACALLLAATATIVELGIGSSGGSLARGGETLALEWSRDRPQTTALAPGEDEYSTLEDVPADALLSLRLMPTYGADPTTDARLTLTRAETPDTAQTHNIAELRIATRATLEARVPQGTGVLEVRLTNVGSGNLAWLAEHGLELWRPAGSARNSSLALALRAFLALAPLLALALGAAVFVGPWTASLGSLCIYLAVLSFLHAPAWYPGADLVRALDVVASGRLPAAISPVSWLLAPILVALGLGLGALGLGSWRHTP